MKYLLDSSTLIQVLRQRAHRSITRRIEELSEGDAVICSVVRLELLYGAARRHDADRSTALVTEFLADFPSLPFDDRAADHAARIRAALASAGTPIGPYDLLIAAIAAANGLTVVTCNPGEFVRVAGLHVENWRTE